MIADQAVFLRVHQQQLDVRVMNLADLPISVRHRCCWGGLAPRGYRLGAFFAPAVPEHELRQWLAEGHLLRDHPRCIGVTLSWDAVFETFCSGSRGSGPR